jgi:hypothetical protein
VLGGHVHTDDGGGRRCGDGSCWSDLRSLHHVKMRALGWVCYGVGLHELAFVSMFSRGDARFLIDARSRGGRFLSKSVRCTALQQRRPMPVDVPPPQRLARGERVEGVSTIARPRREACGLVDHAPAAHRFNPWTTLRVAHRLNLGPQPHRPDHQLIQIHKLNHTSLSKCLPEGAKASFDKLRTNGVCRLRLNQ